MSKNLMMSLLIIMSFSIFCAHNSVVNLVNLEQCFRLLIERSVLDTIAIIETRVRVGTNYLSYVMKKRRFKSDYSLYSLLAATTDIAIITDDLKVIKAQDYQEQQAYALFESYLNKWGAPPIYDVVNKTNRPLSVDDFKNDFNALAEDKKNRLLNMKNNIVMYCRDYLIPFDKKSSPGDTMENRISDVYRNS